MSRKPPSRNRRRRFASRVERAQRRDADKRREANHDDKLARLERRCASLDRLLTKAEWELKAELRPATAEERPSLRAERVAELRERSATEQKRRERAERTRRQIRTRRRIAELRRDADEARRPAPRRRPRRASPRRVRPEDKQFVATYRKGGIAAGDPPLKIFDRDTGKTHFLVKDEK